MSWPSNKAAIANEGVGILFPCYYRHTGSVTQIWLTIIYYGVIPWSTSSFQSFRWGISNEKKTIIFEIQECPVLSKERSYFIVLIQFNGQCFRKEYFKITEAYVNYGPLLNNKRKSLNNNMLLVECILIEYLKRKVNYSGIALSFFIAT